MFKNYMKIAFRNLTRQKGYSFINIAGLAIGVSCCILILLYVVDELSFDRYHGKAERIYRVGVKGIVGNHEFNQVITAAPMAEALVREYPEVIEATRFATFGYPVVRYKDKVFSEEKFYWGDSTFFEVFTIPFLKGDPKTALTRPETVVITRAMAEKYFGDEDPMGKLLNTDNRRDYLVTGVIEDIPHNSHFHFDFLASLETYQSSREQIWLSHNYYTYIVLREGASAEELQPGLTELARKYVGPQLQEAAGISYDQMVESGGAFGYFLQPLTDIHLHSDLDYEVEPNGNATYVYIFSVIAFAILLIACINFMNLATARSANRAKEVGIRKTVGSTRQQLVRQFLAETIFMAVLAIVLALFLVEFFLPLFNNLSGKNLELHYFDNFVTIPALLGLGLFVGLLAGSYPAFFLAAFRPVSVLKGSGLQSINGRSPLLRSGLVIFQFSISVILFIGTFVVYDQLSYIQNKKLGFNKEQIVVVEKTDDLFERITPFMNELRQHANVISVSNMSTLPGKNFGSTAFRLAGTSGEQTHILWTMRSDYDFAKTYEIEMLEGRFFSRDWGTDSSALLLNETAVNALGLTDAVGKELVQLGRSPDESETYKIIGVMKDFHFESLHQKIRPMTIRLFEANDRGRYVSVRVRPDDIRNTLAFLDKTWRKYAHDQAFEYVFFDQEFARLYEAEQRTSKILTVFSVLAIVIACLGLFGLASFITEHRTKEIGIRKVLGASVANVVLLLSKQFTKWVLFASLISWPIAYLVMKKWLDNFAYRTDIHVGVFALAALAALVIALITVSFQTIKAALANPVESLRYE